jgi:uncharacterized protein
VKVLLSGAHGLVGSALSRRLRAEGHLVVVLTRPAGRTAPVDATVRAEDAGNGAGIVPWEPDAGLLEIDDLERAGPYDAVVHLAGAPIGGRRWTGAWKREIRSSRVDPTGLLARRLAALAVRPPVLVSASAVGYYGSRGDEELTEVSAQGDGFLAEVCARWEAATAPAGAAGIRVVHLRSGIVLDAKGGILARMMPPFRWGLGARLGSGEQYVSWITLDDEVGVILRSIGDVAISGPLNACAPGPVTNAAFTTALVEAIGRRPTRLAVPPLALRVALGAEMADELLLVSQRAIPSRLVALGHRFAHPDITSGLNAVLGTGAHTP